MRAHRRHQMRHQIMRQRSLFRHLAHEHCDRAPDRLIDVNDENFVAIPDENCATATGWEYGANMYFNDRFVHCVTVPMEGRKTSCSQPHRRRSEEHTSELQSRGHLVCRLLLEK